ncbi:MAG: membrane protein insertase YidC [Pseudomonadota bacterium]
MDNQRLFAWALFGLMLLMTWQAWQADYATPQSAPVADTSALEIPELEAPIPGDDVPALETTPDAVPIVEPTPDATPSQRIEVITDVLRVQIDTTGGDIVFAELSAYPVDKDRPDDFVVLLSPDPDNYGVFRTGLAGRDKDDAPNHRATFSAARDRYELADGSDTLVVPLTWRNAAGLAVVKEFVFERGRYDVDLTFRVENGGAEAWVAAPYARIVREAVAPDRSMFDVESYSFQGPVVYDGDKYKKHSPGDLDDDPVDLKNVTGGWVAAIEHHFLSAIVPPADGPARIQAGLSEGTFVAGVVGQPVNVAAGATAALGVTLFVGPKLHDQLNDVSPRLELTVDYGVLTLLSDPLFTLLAWIHGFIGNWGWSIIIVTILIKLVFYKLTEKSGRSIAKMRKLQPRMKSIQERYKDDRQALSQAMMELYKREKINPAAGCLPILIQMPFFLAFYWVLLESVEMRQAPFLLWIQDLSSRDPFFILPLAMGAAMFLQQQLNPAPADPVQARVMKVLPIVFTVFFAFFPAGLVLYWFTNTLLGVAQQWKINKVVEAEDKKSRD